MGPSDEAPRWSRTPAVRKEDQFTSAPDFIDVHDSEPMPLWGRLSASWHGMAPQRQVLAVASFLVVAGAVGALVAFTFADFGAGPAPGSGSGPVAAHSSGPLPNLPSATPLPSNSTAPPPLPPLPTLGAPSP